MPAGISLHSSARTESGILRFDIAFGKAWGALGMGFGGSRTLAARVGRSQMFFTALASASEGRFVPVIGGVLIRDAAGDVVGAVGISGDASENDEKCAIAGHCAAAGLKADPGEDPDNQGSHAMLNAAIVGLGWWGKELVRSVQSTSALIRFSRGVTLEPELARDFAAEMKFGLGASYEEILADPKIDAVVLATPHTRHRAQVEAAAARGKHVFCEKPFALNKADAAAAIAACRRAGVALGVGHNRRMWPSIAELKSLVSSPDFGTVMHAEGNYSHAILANTAPDNWRSLPEETKAGGMTGMGIHLLDAFSFLVGPMARVSALATRRTLPLPAGDTTAALISFREGATGTIATTLKTPFVWRLAVYGSEMWAESTSETCITACRLGEEPQTIDIEESNHIGMNIESFARAALGQGAYHIDDAAILHTVSALEAVFRSAEADGAWQVVE